MKAIDTETVERFEANMAEHALFLYCCVKCGNWWGRYIDEIMSECPVCGLMPEDNEVVIEPETLISDWLNGGGVNVKRSN